VFGFSIPNFGGLFGSRNEVSSIESTIRSARSNPYGGYTVALADKSVWSQTDDSPLGFPPRGGDPVTIRRGALGSFVMQVGGQPSVKVKRVE
jgi:topoisomerase IA-like protein